MISGRRNWAGVFTPQVDCQECNFAVPEPCNAFCAQRLCVEELLSDSKGLLTYRSVEMSKEELRWDEKDWAALRWDENSWAELRWHLRSNEKSWAEMRWEERRYDETKWHVLLCVGLQCGRAPQVTLDNNRLAQSAHGPGQRTAHTSFVVEKVLWYSTTIS